MSHIQSHIEFLHNITPPHLNLRSCGMRDWDIQNLVKTFQTDSCEYSHISVPDNAFTSKGVAHLLTVMNETTVQELNLNNNPIGPEGAELLASEFLTDSTALECLSLSGCEIGDDAAIEIINALHACFSRITWLGLSRNKIGGTAMMQLAQALSLCNNNALIGLSIGENDLSDECSFAAFVKALSNCPNLRELFLHDSKLSDASITILCEYLASNKTLQKVIFTDNTLTDSSAAALAHVVHSNQASATILLDSCVNVRDGCAQHTTLQLPDKLSPFLRGESPMYEEAWNGNVGNTAEDSTPLNDQVQELMRAKEEFSEAFKDACETRDEQLMTQAEKIAQLENQIVGYQQEIQGLRAELAQVTKAQAKKIDMHVYAGASAVIHNYAK